jgi:hypothetical protein
VVSALAVLAVAVACWLFFQFTKHNPLLSAVNASGEDPYDAIGSFGVQAAAFFGLLSVARSFWWGRGDGQLSSRQRLLTLRAEMTVVLAVAVTLAGGVAAMVRHPALWIGSSAGLEYAALLVALLVLDGAVGLFVFRTWRGAPGPWAIRDWLWAGFSAFASFAVLLVYPEALRQSIGGELFTVLVGIALLFVPLRLLLLALVPESAVQTGGERPGSEWSAPRGLQWAVVAVAGAFAGLLLVSAEMSSGSGGGAPPLAQLLFVGSVYVGLETAGLLLGYALLRGPVGIAVGISP